MGDEEPKLDENRIYEVLSSQRRRETINYLKTAEEPVSINELAEHIAEIETGVSPPPKDARKTVYVSLHQTHLPELDSLRIVNYDRDDKTIEVADQFKKVTVYMEVVEPGELSWSEYYLALSAIGLATFAAHVAGVPVISDTEVAYWGLFYLAIIAVSALYQTITRRSI
ncbi:MAG: DUF7344 domain-containing protein [Halobacteriota archaeon]